MRPAWRDARRSCGGVAGNGDDFYFVQLSDSHWGFHGPAVNPGRPRHAAQGDSRGERAAGRAPDFIVFTGDLTHTTDDPSERRKRMARVQGDRRAG